MTQTPEHTATGVRWLFISQGSRLLSQFLSLIILARLLPPSDYGLAAMAAVVTGFVSLFRDFGTTAAIIQKPHASSRLLNSLFWLNIVFGIGLAALLGLLAPLVALGLVEPRLKEVLWVLLLTFPIASLGSVQQALLERESRFRPIAIIESTSAFVGLVGGILAAYAGWGVYSLLLQTLLMVIFNTLGFWMVSQWRPKLQWSSSDISDIMGFSGNLVGFNILNYFIRNTDNLLIGKFLGVADLGYYSMAYRLMLWPLQNISSVLGRALFPLFSRLQVNHEGLSIAYIRTTAAITLLTAPLMVGFFVLREPFVAVALGDDWRPVAEILAWLVPVGLLQSIGTTVGSLYLATGRTDIMFKWSIAAGILVIPAFTIGLQWGVTGVAGAYLIASLLLFLPGLLIPFRLVNLRVTNVLLKLTPSIATAILMALVLFTTSAIWPATTDNQTARLALLITIGVVIYGVLSFFIQRALLKDVFRLALNR